MKQDYYKNYKAILSQQGKWRSYVYFGFPKEKLNVEDVREMMKKKYFSNRIILTENLIILVQDICNRGIQDEQTKSKKLFQKARMLKNVIVFAPMSYQEYNVTKTAKNIIIEKNVNEKSFKNDYFISVHENKLSIELKKEHFDISLELKNINVEIEKMEEERDKEIDERILNCLK